MTTSLWSKATKWAAGISGGGTLALAGTKMLTHDTALAFIAAALAALVGLVVAGIIECQETLRQRLPYRAQIIQAKAYAKALKRATRASTSGLPTKARRSDAAKTLAALQGTIPATSGKSDAQQPPILEDAGAGLRPRARPRRKRAPHGPPPRNTPKDQTGPPAGSPPPS